MNGGALSEHIVAALELPPSSQVSLRIAKKELIANCAPSAADRRLINQSIEELRCLAVLKPQSISIPEYLDSECQYREILLFRALLRGQVRSSQKQRLATLIHRAVPYLVLLLLEDEDSTLVSLAHKRKSKSPGQFELTILEEQSFTIKAPPHSQAHPFFAALALSRQHQTHLKALYSSWVDLLVSWQIAQKTGHFSPSPSLEVGAQRWEALRLCEELEQASAHLKAVAAKERQVAKLVELNLELQNIKARLAAAKERL